MFLQAWEDKFKEQILKLRNEELIWLSKVLYRRAYNTVVFWMSPVFVSTATFVTCLFMGTPLIASNVFTALATLRIIQEPIRLIPDLVANAIQVISLGTIISVAIAKVTTLRRYLYIYIYIKMALIEFLFLIARCQVRISLDRIAKFLQEDELQPDAVVRKDHWKTSDYAIEFEEATLTWDPDVAIPTLRNLTAKIKHGQRVAVCGAVGCGKSSFIQAILGEMPKLSGLVCKQTNKVISVSSSGQEPVTLAIKVHTSLFKCLWKT